MEIGSRVRIKGTKITGTVEYHFPGEIGIDVRLDSGHLMPFYTTDVEEILLGKVKSIKSCRPWTN